MFLSRLVVCSLVFLTACVGGAYRRAVREDSIEGYQAFLAASPEGPSADAARGRLEALEFKEAQRLHTVLAYKQYLAKYPEGTQSTAATQLLEGLRFNAARAQDTPAAYRLFLQEHPQGRQREQAEALWAAAEQREGSLLSESDVKEVERRAKHGDPETQKRAAERLDALRFQQAQGHALLLYRYLREAPVGAFREQAHLELLSLEVKSLLFAGRIEEAEARVQGDALGARLPRFEEERKRALERRTLLASREPLVQALQSAFYLRSIDDLLQALRAPDPLDRWQAAEELGAHLSTQVMDPLLETLRSARNPLIRLKALHSLRRVVAALPPELAEFEVARRVERWSAQAGSEDIHLSMAVLLDGLQQPAEAARVYQKAFVPSSPDPVLLSRWTQIRWDRKEAFSAAVAARQLALWARGTSEEVLLDEQSPVLGQARTLCAAQEGVRFAVQVISQATQQRSDFPDDLALFQREAEDAQKRVNAKLQDAERLLRRQRPHALTCADQQVRERLEGGIGPRQKALEQVPSRLPRLARSLLEEVRERDPSPSLRAQAEAELAKLSGP